MVFVAAGLILLLIQSGAGRMLAAGGVRLDGIPALLAWYATRTRSPEGLPLVLLFAYLAQPFTLQPFAAVAALWGGSYLMAGYVLENVDCSEWWQEAALTAFLALGLEVFSRALGSGLEGSWAPRFLQVLADGALAPVLFALFERGIAGGEEEAF